MLTCATVKCNDQAFQLASKLFQISFRFSLKTLVYIEKETIKACSFSPSGLQESTER